MRNLKNTQNTQIDKRINKQKAIKSSKIVTFKGVKVVQNFVLSGLSS